MQIAFKGIYTICAHTQPKALTHQLLYLHSSVACETLVRPSYGREPPNKKVKINGEHQAMFSFIWFVDTSVANINCTHCTQYAVPTQLWISIAYLIQKLMRWIETWTFNDVVIACTFHWNITACWRDGDLLSAIFYFHFSIHSNSKSTQFFHPRTCYLGGWWGLCCTHTMQCNTFTSVEAMQEIVFQHPSRL